MKKDNAGMKQPSLAGKGNGTASCDDACRTFTPIGKKKTSPPLSPVHGDSLAGHPLRTMFRRPAVLRQDTAVKLVSLLKTTTDPPIR